LRYSGKLRNLSGNTNLNELQAVSIKKGMVKVKEMHSYGV